ncbi:Hypothetical protein CINCED_3A008518 [Cinara cedri]|uniref:Uncharacterized protein n=1 Tax=Cinara cedri TaxID=506608 RepID=A0A5E4NQ63_9HEMI|nr:Hypothetical protein CINCED_3A008518 [Cinara cedri]
MYKLYWLVGLNSELNLTSKRLLYISIVKAIWIYGIQLWGCVIKSNIGKIQRCQRITFHTIVAAYRYDKKDTIHRDLKMSSMQVEITRFARKHARKLELHKNMAAIQLAGHQMTETIEAI